MAGDVEMQAEGTKTLHLKALRKDPRVIALQVLASIALIWLFLLMTNTYGHCHQIYEANGDWCPALDHTKSLDWIETYFGQQMADPDYDLPLPDFFTGQGNSGYGKYTVPMVISMLIAGGWVALNFQPPSRRRKIMLGVLVSMILFLAGKALFGWLLGMLFSFDLYLPFNHADASKNHADALIWPLSVYIQVFVVGLVVAPVGLGLAGIWGLAKKKVNWAIAYILIFLGFHALFSYEGVVNSLGTSTNPTPGLDPLPTQIGEADALGGLVAGDILSLILIAVLLLIFMETAHAIIRFLEYAFRLPESCKKDPEYVGQFENLLNIHIQHTVVIMSAVAFVTMLAMKFDDLIVDLVLLFDALPWFDTAQWVGQVQESLELRLTYGKVISAVLLVTIVAGLRFVIPWQRVAGAIESLVRGGGLPGRKAEAED